MRLVADEPTVLVFESADTMLRVAKLDSHQPAPHTVLGWEVDDIELAAEVLIDRGLTPTRFSGMHADARGIVNFPDGTRVMWFYDPDQNLLSLTEFAGEDFVPVKEEQEIEDRFDSPVAPF